jgi:hypothetical protein
MGISANTTAGTETDSVLKAFLSGFFQNTALLQPDGTYRSVVGGQTISIHPASSMFGKRVEAIMYNELVSHLVILSMWETLCEMVGLGSI